MTEGARKFVRSNTARCSDCGVPMAPRKGGRQFCRKCKPRHHPKSKTAAIINFYRRKDNG